MIKAQELLDQHKYDECLVLLNQLVTSSDKGQQLQALNMKGLLLMQENQTQDSLTVLDQIINLDPEKPEVYYRRASVFEQLLIPGKAVEDYNKCIDLKYKIQECHYFKAISYQRQGNLSDATKEYELALEFKNSRSEQDGFSDYEDLHLNMALICIKQTDLNGALVWLDKATTFNSRFLRCWAYKAQVQQSLNLHQLALNSVKAAKLLLQDPSVIKAQSVEQISYITDSLNKILLLDCKFNLQSSYLEISLQLNLNDETNQQFKEVVSQYQALKIQKEQIQNVEYMKITVDSTKIEPQTIHDSEQMFQQIQQLNDNMKQILVENQGLKKQIEDYHSQTQTIQTQQDQMKQSLTIIGVYDQALISKEWNEYYSQQPDLYNYTKAFYWTLLSCFDAYRIANTGALQTNTGHVTDTQSNNVDKFSQISLEILQYGAKIESYVPTFPQLPVISTITGYIDTAVEYIYNKIKDKRYDDRINAINRIICLNNDSTAQTSEQQSRMIEMASLEIAKRKREILEGKRVEALLPTKTNEYQKSVDFINSEMDKIYDAALGKKIVLFTTLAGKEALKDVTLLLVYLTQQHEIIIDLSKTEKLHLILADCVVDKKTLEIVNQIQIGKKPPTSDKEAERQSKCCIIM